MMGQRDTLEQWNCPTPAEITLGAGTAHKASHAVSYPEAVASSLLDVLVSILRSELFP